MNAHLHRQFFEIYTELKEDFMWFLMSYKMNGNSTRIYMHVSILFKIKLWEAKPQPTDCLPRNPEPRAVEKTKICTQVEWFFLLFVLKLNSRQIHSCEWISNEHQVVTLPGKIRYLSWQPFCEAILCMNLGYRSIYNEFTFYLPFSHKITSQ